SCKDTHVRMSCYCIVREIDKKIMTYPAVESKQKFKSAPEWCPTLLVTSGPPLLSALPPHCSPAPPGNCQPPGLCPWTPSAPGVPGD
ncbi:unnamed protein product, partial [Rangifer tarandus platyrhynchus]